MFRKWGAAAAARKEGGRRGDADQLMVRGCGKGKARRTRVTERRLDRSRPQRSNPTDDNDSGGRRFIYRPGRTVFGSPSTLGRSGPGHRSTRMASSLLRLQSPTGTAWRPAPPRSSPASAAAHLQRSGKIVAGVGPSILQNPPPGGHSASARRRWHAWPVAPREARDLRAGRVGWPRWRLRHHRPSSLAVRASRRRMNHERQVANGRPGRKGDNFCLCLVERSPFMFEVMISS